TKGGVVHGTNVDVATNEALQKALAALDARWERAEKNATTGVDNQAALLSLSKGLDGINQGNNALLELAQQASAQIASAGGSLGEVEFTNPPRMPSQRVT